MTNKSNKHSLYPNFQLESIRKFDQKRKSTSLHKKTVELKQREREKEPFNLKKENKNREEANLIKSQFKIMAEANYQDEEQKTVCQHR